MNYKTWKPGPVDAQRIEEYLSIIDQQPPKVLTEALREQFAGELQQLLEDFSSIGEEKAGERFHDIVKRAMRASGQEQ